VIPAVPSTATRSDPHNDVQYGIDQRHPVRQHAADAAASRDGGHRGARSARHSAHGTAHACSSRVEAAARTTHATRSSHAMCVMVGLHLAASTRPRRAGRRRAGRRRWAARLRHEIYQDGVRLGVEREFCLLKGIAEGTYSTKHAEAARLYYTTTYIHTHTPTELQARTRS